jgi:4a-hydroxytetrahydrobiopterin dehydratase
MAPLSDADIDARLAELPGWERSDARPPAPAAITREWKLGDFAQALAFVNRVGEAAEAANHHPDILLHSWNRVRLTLSTHSDGGLTDSDFSLARKVDELA